MSYSNNSFYNPTISMIKRNEGFVPTRYKDETSGKKAKSIGYGFNVTEDHVIDALNKFGVNPNGSISREQADKVLNYLVTNYSIPTVKRYVKNFDNLNDRQKAALIDMSYQLGQPGFSRFKEMIKNVNNGDFKGAEYELANSNMGRNASLIARTFNNRHALYPDTDFKYVPSAQDIKEGIKNFSYNFRNEKGIKQGIRTKAQLEAAKREYEARKAEYAKLFGPYNYNNYIQQPNPIAPNTTQQQVRQPVAAPATATPPNNPTYYKVQRGDTMGGIGKKHGVPLNKLKILNPDVKNFNKIKPGQLIRTSQLDQQNQLVPNQQLVAANNMVDPNTLTKTGSWAKLANDLNNKLAKMKKEIPVDNMEIKSVAINTDKPNSIEDIFNLIYNEDKKYWPFGLNLSLYNGKDDKINLIKTDDGDLAGFSAVQVRSLLDPSKKPSAFYSVGIIPEHRGKGLASKALKQLLEENKDKDYKHMYTVHKDNKPSLALYNNIITDYPELTLKIFN